MTHETQSPQASAARILAYLERRRKARGIDHEEIHAFDASPDGGIYLRASDLEIMAQALVSEPSQSPSVLDEAEFCRVLSPYVNAMIAENEWAEIAPVGMTRKQAAKETRLARNSEKAWSSLWGYVTSVACHSGAPCQSEADLQNDGIVRTAFSGDEAQPKLTRGQKEVLMLCPDWSAAWEVAERRVENGTRTNWFRTQDILLTLEQRGLVEYGEANRTYRITEKGRAIVVTSDHTQGEAP
ncbi:hypothetical protein G6L37_07295 [Agrobacterium rubi]|nr:hypothetical protein [Agrobacterium rubi]NTF25172.1 hypothetical protein [Agrobacterium rubi]